MSFKDKAYGVAVGETEKKFDDIPTPPSSDQSAPSRAPLKRGKSTLDRSKLSNPNLSKPPAERGKSKQTVIPIKKPRSSFFRICPWPETRLEGVTVLMAGFKPRVISLADVNIQVLPKDAIKVVNLCLAQNEEGDYFVAYFAIGMESWADSAELVVQEAEKEWIAIEANMSDGGYRISYAKHQYPTLAARNPGWGNEFDDPPIEMFEAAISQTLVASDAGPAIIKLLKNRQ